MDTAYHFEALQSAGQPRHSEYAESALKIVSSTDRKPAAPAAEFGSGWYHDEAISHSREVVSHRSM